MENQIKVRVRRYQNLLIPVISVVIGVGLLTIIIVPQAIQVPQTNGEIEKKRQTLSIINQKISDLQSIDLAKYQNYLNTALTALPLERDEPSIITTYQKYLSLDGLSPETLSVANQDTEAKELTPIRTQISATGSRTSLVSFIDHLNQIPRIMKIDSLSSTTVGTSDNQEISLGVNVFYQPFSSAQPQPAEKSLENITDQNVKTLNKISGLIQADQALFANRPATASTQPVGGKADPFQ